MPARAFARSRFTRRLAALATASVLLLTLLLVAAPTSAAALSTGYRLPFVAGTKQDVTANWQGTANHKVGSLSEWAYDFGMPEGTQVAASARGVVHEAVGSWSADHCGGSAYATEVNRVVLYHDDGTATLYLHLKSVSVTTGQVVAPGQVIGLSGHTGYTNTGSGCKSHLHFQRQNQGSTTWTSSIKIYFEEKPGVELGVGSVYTSQNPECSQTSMPTGSFCGKYFKGIFSGPEYFSRKDYPINFNWGTGGPGGYWLNTTTDFSVRWVGKFAMTAGTYRFFLNASDGIKLYIDDMTTPKFSSWSTRSTSGIWQPVFNLTAATHTIKVEYYNDDTAGGAIAAVAWTNCNEIPC